MATATARWPGWRPASLLWAYTLLLPSFSRSDWLPQSFLEDGPLGIELLRPEQLFGLAGFDSVSHAMFWTMLANVGLYVGVSLFTRPSAAEHGQAALFVDVIRAAGRGRAVLARHRLGRGARVHARSLPRVRPRARRARRATPASGDCRQHERTEADAELVHHVETLLAGSIGAASARVMVASVVEEEPLGIDEVMDILDETSQVIAHSRELERKSQELEAATSELRGANRRLRELDRLKDDFVSTVTHELRTPLTSMRAFAEILLDNPELPRAERERFLRIVVEEIERLSRLINQVLDLSKIESGRAEWDIAAVDLAEVIEESATAAAQLLAARQAELQVSVPGEVPSVPTDRDRVKQVLLNLLSNAAKFCDEERGRVAVELAVEDGVVRVDVRDNGPGIDPEDQEVIFDRFRQGDQTMTERPRAPGSGCRSAARSSGSWAASSGSTAHRGRARLSRSCSRGPATVLEER